ncbi:MAG: VOC family protein [Psychroserpens sp.]|nr:VOC family protein [Psychroserpens sp.]
MTLGAFSVSLSVKNIQASKTFYETLGFSVFAGDIDRHYLIMKNGDSIIGLFQGMFEQNILTFNPGWDQDAKTLDKFDDVRDIQKHLKSNNIEIERETDSNSSGPASIVFYDPDGNTILIDQHV